MTNREAAIISAYTGVLLGGFHEAHKYMEEIMDRPILTHEMGDKEFMTRVKELARNDFLSLTVEDRC
jgi:hypothetical protein